MATDVRLKDFIRRLVHPLWRRIWMRIETRLMPVEIRISALEDRIAPLEDRISALEVEWQENMPALLNTVSTVGAFGHELVHIRRDLEEKIAVLRQEIDMVNREMHPDPKSRHSD